LINFPSLRLAKIGIISIKPLKAILAELGLVRSDKELVKATGLDRTDLETAFRPMFQ